MNRVKELRKKNKIKQIELAAAIHVSQQYISKVENNQSFLTEELILKVSDYFHVSIDYLLGLTEDPCKKMNIEHDKELLDWIRVYYELNKKNKDTIFMLSEYLVNKQEI